MNQIKTMFSPKAAKAFVAGTVAAITAATLASVDGFTFTEILTIFGALVVTFQAAYWTPNAKSESVYSGSIDVAQLDGKKVFSLNLDSDPTLLDTMDEVSFKINK